jgi:hypothetical protein
MKDKNGDEWLFCGNCSFEYKLKELPLFYDEVDNSVKAFCPNCNFIEFVGEFNPQGEFDSHSQEDYKVYPKPERILKEVEC